MNIRHLHSSEKPREKLLAHGAESLSDVELLAILISSGVKGKSAIELSRDLLKHFGGLCGLLHADMKQFSSFSGMGQVKYIQLQTILEISQRYLYEDINHQEIGNSLQVQQFLLAKLSHKEREVFACILLDNQLRIIKYVELFHGSIRQADIHLREIVKTALAHNAAAVIIAHNHTSGCPNPSQADIHITKKIREALRIVDIRLIDHLIIGKGKIRRII